MGMTCECCRYWSPFSGRWGMCRRHSPLPLVTERESVQARWPETHETDTCGEWQRIFPTVQVEYFEWPK